MSWWQWSKTADNNGTADPTIDFAEGQSPSSVNDSARALMARAAEYRDDTSGLLATGGTSAAFTLTTNQGLQAVPQNGQLIAFTPHVANAAAATLAADGGTAYHLQSPAGTNIPAGVIVAGTPYAATFNLASSAWVLFGVTAAAIQASLPGQCYLAYSSATQIVLIPRGGSNLTINGVVYQVPSGGLARANTNVYVNSVPGQNLGASGTYNVYGFVNSGSIELDFRIGGGSNHMRDTTAGNVGIEVLDSSGSGTPDSRYTYLGKISTNASSQFQPQGNGVISWYNRTGIRLIGVSLSGVTTTGTNVEFGSSARVPFLTFGDDTVRLESSGLHCSNNTAGESAILSTALDGSGGTIGFADQNYSSSANKEFSLYSFLDQAVAEGTHYNTVLGSTSNPGGVITASFSTVVATVGLRG